MFGGKVQGNDPHVLIPNQATWGGNLIRRLQFHAYPFYMLTEMGMGKLFPFLGDRFDSENITFYEEPAAVSEAYLYISLFFQPDNPMKSR
jgi:hypothetical protein